MPIPSYQIIDNRINDGAELNDYSDVFTAIVGRILTGETKLMGWYIRRDALHRWFRWFHQINRWSMFSKRSVSFVIHNFNSWFFYQKFTYSDIYIFYVKFTKLQLSCYPFVKKRFSLSTKTHESATWRYVHSSRKQIRTKKKLFFFSFGLFYRMLLALSSWFLGSIVPEQILAWFGGIQGGTKSCISYYFCEHPADKPDKQDFWSLVPSFDFLFRLPSCCNERRWLWSRYT